LKLAKKREDRERGEGFKGSPFLFKAEELEYRSDVLWL